ncbi:MAG: hypothetical protein A2086_16445 [Spirochaetes bacterium GWD1_27_9]|nr:MAG: hypothetical protein A2086_16445 [Spirochaetes bacterium GWD1_27_9]
MLINFTVGNYLSFKDKVSLNMNASSIKEREEENIIIYEKYKLLKSAAIYGANASGKSNLLKALGFMRWLVINSSKETTINEEIDIYPFKLSTETENKPSFFEIIFLLNDKTYRYGFEIDRKEVKAEWLYQTETTKEKLLFIRNKDIIEVKKHFKEGKNLEEKTRNNALFLSVAANFNGFISLDIINWFTNFKVISGLKDDNYSIITMEMLDNEDTKKKIYDFIKNADLGIMDISLSKEKFSEKILPKGMPDDLFKSLSEKFKDEEFVNINTYHQKFNEKNEVIETISFLLDEESSGTNKYFNLSGLIVKSLLKGSILAIDEIDAKLHPLLTKAIIELFNSSKTNKNNAQLIFVTHDTNLLTSSLLRRDQIWFTEKNRYEATDLYSLVEYKIEDKKVRNDASYQRDYISGKYGAIPFIGNFEAIFGEING